MPGRDDAVYLTTAVERLEQMLGRDDVPGVGYNPAARP